MYYLHLQGYKPEDSTKIPGSIYQTTLHHITVERSLDTHQCEIQISCIELCSRNSRTLHCHAS